MQFHSSCFVRWYQTYRLGQGRRRRGRPRRWGRSGGHRRGPVPAGGERGPPPPALPASAPPPPEAYLSPAEQARLKELRGRLSGSGEAGEATRSANAPGAAGTTPAPDEALSSAPPAPGAPKETLRGGRDAGSAEISRARQARRNRRVAVRRTICARVAGIIRDVKSSRPKRKTVRLQDGRRRWKRAADRNRRDGWRFRPRGDGRRRRAMPGIGATIFPSFCLANENAIRIVLPRQASQASRRRLRDRPLRRHAHSGRQTSRPRRSAGPRPARWAAPSPR